MSINLYDNIKRNVAKPLDEDEVVAAYTNLNDGLIYEGMVRYVKATKKRYLYNGTSWAIFGDVSAGAKGDPGTSATIQIGTVTSGTTPSVTNAGTASSAILNFVLVKGDPGSQGTKGDPGNKGDQGDKGDKGDNYRIDARGSRAGRNAFDGQNRDFVYLIDNPADADYGYIYFNNGNGTWSNAFNFVGDKGWTPTHGLIEINTNTVYCILTGFIGGNGTPPLDVSQTTYYVTTEGYSTSMTNAINLRGSQGTKGDQGVPGVKGDQGTQGGQGNQGLSTWLAYADDSSGTNSNLSPSGKSHVSFLQAATQPALSSFTNWTRFKGDTGTSVWVAYATSATGTGFTTTPTAGANYISTLQATTQPTAEQFTVWHRFRGEDAKDDWNSLINKPTLPTTAIKRVPTVGTILKATKFEDAIKELFWPFMPATVTLNSFTTTYEHGSTAAITVAGAITANDEPTASITNRRVLKNGSAWSTFTNLSYSIADSVTANTTYQTFASTGNDGVPVDISSPVRTVSFDHKHFFGPSSTETITASSARILSGNSFKTGSSTQILTTGTTNKIFIICLTPGKSLGVVTDLDALNKVITSEYVLTDSNFTVNDAGGNAVTGYKLYVKSQDVAYGETHRHQFTII